VVARRPSSNPSAASTKAPVHTEATLRARGASSPTISRAAATTSGACSSGMSCSPGVKVKSGGTPPGTINVSMRSGTSASGMSTLSATNDVVSTASPVGDARITRYRAPKSLARAKISSGAATSCNVTLLYKANTTVLSGFGPLALAGRRGLFSSDTCCPFRDPTLKVGVNVAGLCYDGVAGER
jgi:hypothetical protein